ncbi:hypothetical protein DYB25_011657 [Aphanomyces astaci]|uniref:Uncharacterized protein n=1 Tax=Aphanomyces astaci TaxID=112090 RepID=A0A397BKE3_APHAT|nr:hypothetical protein DYB25_011657 [Aphanomyces astaci]
MPKPDTGRWENIHKAEYVAKPMSSFGGMDFEIKGKKLSKKSQRAINQACAATPTRRHGTDVNAPPSVLDEGTPQVEDDERDGGNTMIGASSEGGMLRSTSDNTVVLAHREEGNDDAKNNDNDDEKMDGGDGSGSRQSPSVGLPPDLDELL